MKTRRSVREFKREPVMDEDLRVMLECALLAPSGSNLQPWEFFVVRDRERLTKLSEVHVFGRFIKDSPCCVVVTGDEKESTHVVEDCSAATENILLAAHALGYGACWVAGWNRPYESEVLDIVRAKEVSPTLRLVSMVAVGFPEERPSSKRKRAYEEAVHFVD
jgi:nitroreductase